MPEDFSFEEFADNEKERWDFPALQKKLAEAVALKEIVDQLEDDLAAAKKQLNHLNTVALPDMMAELGIDEISQGGWDIKINEFVSGSLPKDPEKRAEAIRWLEDNNAADLIKTELTIQFAKSQHNMALDLNARIEAEGFEPTLESGVHAQTLAAFARERMRNGEPLDTELLGLFTGRVAKYSKRKK